MNILVDHQIFVMQKFGGISRYFTELISHLREYDDVKLFFPVTFSDNENLLESTFFKNKIDVPKFKFPFKRNLVEYLNKQNYLDSCKLLTRQEYQVFHPTYYDDYFLKFLKGKPYVLTIHDMTHEVYPHLFAPADDTSLLKKKLAQNAARIITISNHTKNDIVKFFGIADHKIEVVYLGNSLTRTTRQKSKNLPQRYVLFVGQRSGYKNFTRFIRSLAPLLQKDESLQVIAAGSKNFDANEKSLFKKLGLNGRIVHQKIRNSNELSLLYSYADAFIFPSLYEGFGIPVLEAFACQCPAIISNTSSLCEIGDKAARYFEPESEESIRSVIESVIYNDEKRQIMIRQGLERLKHFSWHKMSGEILDIYRSVV